jgi:hypothetical protein
LSDGLVEDKVPPNGHSKEQGSNGESGAAGGESAATTSGDRFPTSGSTSNNWTPWSLLGNGQSGGKHKTGGSNDQEDSIELSKVTTTHGGALLFHRKRKKHRKKRQKGDGEKESKQQELFENDQEDGEEEDMPGYHPLQADIESSEASM